MSNNQDPEVIRAVWSVDELDEGQRKALGDRLTTEGWLREQLRSWAGAGVVAVDPETALIMLDIANALDIDSHYWNFGPASARIWAQHPEHDPR